MDDVTTLPASPPARPQRQPANRPRAGTVRAAVLADLQAGRRITHMDCWREHGSSRLAAHIHQLRCAGWPIRTQEVEVPTSDGRRARIASYWLQEAGR